MKWWCGGEREGVGMEKGPREPQSPESKDRQSQVAPCQVDSFRSVFNGFYVFFVTVMDWIRLHVFIFLLVLCWNTCSSELGSSCTKDRHCKIDNSFCSSGVCTCKHYHAQLGTTACLESKLLGRECLVNEQCSLRVANSTCRDGHCQCAQGFIRFRKHTCLGPAKLGDVCYSDEHCRLSSVNSHCQFLIPKLFGKCVCDNKEKCGSGVDETSSKPSATDSTLTSETDPKLNSTEPVSTEQVSTELYSGSEAQENENISEDKNSGSESQKNGENTTEEELRSEGETNEGTSDDAAEVTTAPNVAQVKPEEMNEGSKYRVEASEKGSKANPVNWDEIAAVSLGYSCKSDLECQKRDFESRCLNGVCDCFFKGNGTNICGRENPGCGPETFQCRDSGLCISWFFVCDGREDCPDGSDEECGGPKCPKPSFQCGSRGGCVSLAVICDGTQNCPNGEDERFCLPKDRNVTKGCPPHTLQCANGQCLPKFEFCNAIPKCADGSDESPQLCSSQGLNKKPGKRRNCPFECGNGRCRSTAIVCSGRDGCGDNSDEAKCSVCSCPKIPSK